MIWRQRREKRGGGILRLKLDVQGQGSERILDVDEAGAKES